MTDLDFDLHGTVRVRLLAARPGDATVLQRQLGLDAADPSAEPDVTVRFVDRLETAGPLTYVGYPEAGYDSRSFLLLHGRHGAPARTRLPFADIGSRRCDIVTERGVGAVPHLIAVINLIALTKDVLPLHASAFVLDGRGVLATGWSKGGKTETLLAFAGHGARYVADEWVYLTPDGTMVGVPEPIRLWHWHLRQLPDLWAGLPATARARLTLLDAAATRAERAATRLPPVASVLRRGAPVLRRQAYRQIAPRDIFGAANLVTSSPLDAVFLVTSHDRPDVLTERITGDEVAETMRASLAEERSAFLAHYRQSCFAFPDRVSALVEHADEIERKLLTRVFGGRPAYRLSHPYPFRLATLVEPVRAALSDLASSARDHSATANEGARP